MIDLFSMVLTIALTVFVVLRAMKLDRQLPWFERPKPPQTKSLAPVASRFATGRAARLPIRR